MRSLLMFAAVAGCLARVEAADLRGRVSEQRSGSPVGRSRVTLAYLPKGGRGAVAETGDSGEFIMSGLLSGRYRLEVSKTGYAGTAVYGTLESEGDVVIRLAKCGAISGRVTTDSGASVRGAEVFLLIKPGRASGFERSRSNHATARTDDRGRYRLYDLPPGDYAVAVSSAGTASGSGITIVSEGGNPRVFSVVSGDEFDDANVIVTTGAARSVEGLIDAEKIQGAVLITLAARDQPAIALDKVIVGEDGRFRFDGVRPGAYFLFAAAPSRKEFNGGLAGVLGPAPVFGRADVVLAYEDQRNLSVSMGSGRKVAFRLAAEALADAAAPCAANATVQLSAIEDWGARIDRSVEVRLGSESALPGLPPARYVVTLKGLPNSCYFVGDPVLDLAGAPSETVVLRVAPGVSIGGRLVAAGADGPAAHAVAIRPESPADGELASLVALPDPRGIFSIENLRPGRYRIVAVPFSDFASPQWKPEASRSVELELVRGSTEVDLPVYVSPPQ